VRVTSKAEYALLVLVELALLGPGRPFATTREVATRQELPLKLLPQVVSLLRDEGWVLTEPGRGGGIRLAADPTRVPVLDVIRAVDGPDHVRPCLAPEGRCPRGKGPERGCVLRGLWSSARAAAEEVLSRTTLADLVRAHRELSNKAPARRPAERRPPDERGNGKRGSPDRV